MIRVLAISDYSTNEVHFYKVRVNSGMDIDDKLIYKLGHHPSNSSWMYAEDIGIIQHVGIYEDNSNTDN